MSIDLQKIHLVIGLGNPGDSYKNTYHNAGQLFLDSLREDKLWREKSKFFSYKEIDGIAIVKPLTFMNESGKAAQAIIAHFKVKPAEILVAHDDSDIELGRYKISFDRSAGGHNGVQSIIDALGTKKFWRLRLGVRPRTQMNADPLRRSASEASQNADERGSRIAGDDRRKSAARLRAGDFVLKKISKADKTILEGVFGSAKDEILKN